MRSTVTPITGSCTEFFSCAIFKRQYSTPIAVMISIGGSAINVRWTLVPSYESALGIKATRIQAGMKSSNLSLFFLYL
jgi:hypothetical protein